MSKKVIVNLFPRRKYPVTANAKPIFPTDRKRLISMLGGADTVWIHTRVYGKDTGVSLDFACSQGCLGDEPPSEGIREFAITKSNTNPALPYDGTNMAQTPNDGVFSIAPQMGLVDIAANIGGATGFIEFESWATLIYNG